MVLRPPFVRVVGVVEVTAPATLEENPPPKIVILLPIIGRGWGRSS
jgi:hypothetical protein